MNERSESEPRGPEPLRPISDLAGMPVEDASGHNIGELFGALAEARSGLLRYFDLSLFNRSRHILVPVGHARVENRIDEPRLRLRAATLDELEKIPPYHARPEDIDDPYERALLHAHGRSFHGERYYAHPAYDHSGLYAGDHPVLRGYDVEGEAHALRPLRELRNVAFAGNDADVRGWSVEAADGESAGVVDDLIVDTAVREIRYAIVMLSGDERRVLIPVGFLRLDRGAAVVRAPGLSADDVRALPAYGGGEVDRDAEDATRAALEARVLARNRYASPDFHPPF
jgi:hypothetical protein